MKELNKVFGFNVSFVVFLLVISFLCFVIVFIIVINDILNNEVWVFFLGGISGFFVLVVVVFLIR